MSEDKKVENRGAPKGKRPVTFICAGIKDNELIHESFDVEDQDPNPDFDDKTRPGIFPKAIALDLFNEKYGMEPQSVIGPIYFRKGGQRAAIKSKRLPIDRENYDKYVISNAPQKEAAWGSWIGIMRSVENDMDKAFFVPVRKSDTDNTKKVNLPGAGFVNMTDLIFNSQKEEEMTITV